MSFPVNYLMNIASMLFFSCYIPEAYANIHNKNANVYNVPEKIILLCGTGFALSYAITIKDTSLILNYAPLLTLDVTMLSIRIYYAYFHKKNDYERNDYERNDFENVDSDIPNPIHNTQSFSNKSIDESIDYDI